ncbi:molybdopterin synthase catalytic subunit MoaE [Methylobacillus gramineus]|uniref:molybdopterin synthase catalytic subunit MoaE n=1 Tax=Methylobacillus gramineus TaxID=755169 RepID=UPI001CFF93B0|nr:molybdopterin synthase catalytic subunit MoaE [Methylobacillus gramineus]MCB5184104.1 molybdopterin synthase catalytic subunit MoaE [Methylobacillus gramineus]
MTVSVQQADFDAGEEIRRLRLENPEAGAVVSFVGQVRDLNQGEEVASLTLEHYPGMTEKSLTAIITQAQQRWAILDVTVIHRIGTLQPMDQIVLVAVSSAHRGEAFNACEFIMDYLKTEAPFWKKETTSSGEHWLAARDSDQSAKQRWHE